jgi:protocatechuate 3,4-dioxygenase alpha subunit
MAQDLGYLKESPSQTAGPYVHIGCTPNFSGIEGVYPVDLGAVMVNERTKGERITVTGRILDGFGAPLRFALV